MAETTEGDGHGPVNMPPETGIRLAETETFGGFFSNDS